MKRQFADGILMQESSLRNFVPLCPNCNKVIAKKERDIEKILSQIETTGSTIITCPKCGEQIDFGLKADFEAPWVENARKRAEEVRLNRAREASLAQEQKESAPAKKIENVAISDSSKEDLDKKIDKLVESKLQQLNLGQTTSLNNLGQPHSTDKIIFFELQTRDSLGTNYSKQEWLSMLDEMDQFIDLKALSRKQGTSSTKDNYGQEGYINLLIALYDSKKSDSEIEKRLLNDSYTRYVLSFLRRLKSKGVVQYDPGGSEYSTLKYIFENLFVQGEGAERSSEDGLKTIRTRELSFTNSFGEKILLIRETEMSPSKGATMLTFRLKSS